MIAEINYTALHWDNHQGGSGSPFTGRLLRNIGNEATLAELQSFAISELTSECDRTKNLIGNYRLINIVIEI